MDWTELIRQHRRQKDEQFADSHHSPLPPAERDSFDGLDYYPVDPDLRFVLPVHEHDHEGTVVLATSTDGEQEYLEYGEFRFSVESRDVTLQAYKSDADQERLWVPFRDATSGTETYGAGRYLDLEPDTHRTDGEWILDFNQAYNPTCAYSDRYECPLPPTDNWLDVPIGAGEKAFDGH